MTQQTAKQTKTAQQQYAVGDKVRILNVDGIWLAREQGYKNGDIAEVIRLAPKGQPFIPAKNGGKLVIARSELKHIEKVAEQMTKKFKVGDTVRIVSTNGQPLSGFSDGDIVTVTSIRFSKNRGEYRYAVEKNGGEQRGYGGGATFELVNAKPTQSTPKKKARLSALEAQVAELTAKVEALEKAQKPTIKLADTVAEIIVSGKSIGKVDAVPVTFNEQRKAIIAEAKAFEGSLPRTASGRYLACGKYDCTVEYIVNSEKRTVVALLKGMASGIIRYKGVAKCAPDDVFNADIGKAIALGRALGLDVKRFEQAVKPTEVVVGQIIRNTGSAGGTRACTEVIGGCIYRGNCYITEQYAVITSDTDAQY